MDKALAATEVASELTAAAASLAKLADCASVISDIAQLITDALRAGNKVMFCGNGGSAADSQHLAAELVGRYLKDRPGLAALALTVDTSALTAIANDYAYADVFARQVQALGRPGDVLIGLSTSGNSENVVRAFEVAANLGLRTVAFTGASGGRLATMADIALRAPADRTNRIQEMHITAGHVICGRVEAGLFADAV